MVNPESEIALEDEEIEDLINYNLKIIGVNKVNLEIERKSDDGISCLVKIQPTAKKVLERLKLPLGSWSFRC